MAVKAYLLMEVAIGKVSDVVAAVRELPHVVTADAVAGPYDIIAILEAEEADQIGQMVMDRVHQIAGINYTMTCIAVGA